MIRRRVVATTALSTIVVAGLVTAGIAHARSAAQDAGPATSLVLTLTAQDGVPRSVSLECEPTGGSHPHAADACAVLKKADGRIDHIRAKPGAMCPHLVAPVQATAVGTYDSTPVNYDHTWNNSCELTRATGELFDF